MSYFDLAELKGELIRGECVPFLGAGCSYDALPDAQKLSGELAKKVGLTPSQTRRRGDCRCKCKNHSELALDLVASYYAAARPRSRLDEFLQARFGSGGPLAIHRFLGGIASAKPLLIMTTNYDRLMEVALTGRAFDVLAFMSNEADQFTAAPLTWMRYNERGVATKPEHRVLPHKLFQGRIDLEARTLLYKMHGSVAERGDRSRFMITQEDYERALLDLHHFLPPIILDHLDGRRLLFLGSGLKDWNVRALMRSLLGYVKLPGYAVVKAVSEADRRIWEKQLVFEESDLTKFVRKLGRARGA